MKATAALVTLLVVSTIFGGPAGVERGARISAGPGGPFSSPVIVNDNKAMDQSEPAIVAMPDGGLFVVWEDQRSGAENPDIYVSKSIDNGTTYGPNKRADDSIGSSRQVKPSVSVSQNGTILLTWQDNRRSWIDYDIYFAKSYDGGSTFTRNVKVDDSNGTISWQENPSITVTSGDVIYIGWRDDRLGPGKMRIRGAYSTNGGETFSSSAEIVANGSTSEQTGLVLTSNGNRIFAAFMDTVSGVGHPYACSSTNGGKSFGTPVRLDSVVNRSVIQNNIAIAPMPGGGIAAAWEDNRNGNPDIYACILSAQGKITTPDFRVDDDLTGAWQTNPSVAADQLGNIYAAWTDERDGLYAIRFAYLMAGATQFNASIEVAGPGVNDMQRASSVVSPAPGRVFVVWQDDKANTYDVYSSGAFFSQLFGLFIEDGWNFVSIPTDGYSYRASTLGLKSGDSVVEWNSSTQTYSRSYLVGVSPPSFDFPIKGSTGYWIYTHAHERLNLKGIVPTAKQHKDIQVPSRGGWDFVGFESLNITRRASDIPTMLNVTGAIASVASYNPTTKTYDKSYAVGFPSTDFVLVPGQAYACYFFKSATLTYTP